MNDDTTLMQQAHMQKVIDWAIRSQQTLESIAMQRAGDVHFRPSSSGVAMVGLQPHRPQRGKSGFRNLDRLSQAFEALYEQHCVAVAQGRPTPEKRLQSWIVADAYQHGRRMDAIESAMGEGYTLWFVADELALPLANKRRVVCDLLALREGPEGQCWPVVMELKAAREMTRLMEQVRGYADCMQGLSNEFARLYSAVLGRSIVFSAPPEQWIVWPQAGADADPREDALAEQGIRLMGYQEEPHGFSLRAGRVL